ncbi:acetyl-CoA carboxylase biotin carboxylase subunit [Achromobacter aloeverae]
MPKKIETLLVANRGEIAVRVIRAGFDEGMKTAVVTSAADRDSLPAQLADRAINIGPAPASQSYLVVDKIIAAARALGADAIHPGYGFLSEQPALAEACAAHGIVFVGPSVDSMIRGGDKVASRNLAASCGVPVSEGVPPEQDNAAFKAQAAAIGYPVLIKAAAGGGGRGMKLVRQESELIDARDTAVYEAQQAFGDGRVFVERFVEHARHVEVQVLGDGEGNVIHLGTRDCSIQRRYQKVIEEAPAPDLSDDLRNRIHASAVALCSELKYTGAGTVEFLVDTDRDSFSFLEINTRVQVEHPVTEAVTGVDIVREQLAIADGEGLRMAQADVGFSGHAVECRITCEDPRRSFMPAPGTITKWVVPQGAGVRVDTHAFPGYTVPPHYDSLLAKLICWGETREKALELTRRALDHFIVEGISTNIEILRDLVRDPEFSQSAVTTQWLETKFLPAWQQNQEARA